MSPQEKSQENSPGKNIAIIGGSGFIGSKLTEALLQRGYSITIIDLVPPRTTAATATASAVAATGSGSGATENDRISFKKINLANAGGAAAMAESIDPQLLSGFYGVVNLAGITIGKRWDEAYKKSIYDSRIATTKAIVKYLALAEIKPHVVVNASAAGYYGDQKEENLSEDHQPGEDFLAHVCVDWEAAAKEAKSLGIRVALIRTAHVIGPGGLLAALQPLFKWGLGGYFGSGKQYMPWIHWSDIVGIYMYALENAHVEGPYNVGAGTPISQKTLFKAFAKSIHAPIAWRIPRFVARLVLGEFADALIDSQHTSSQKIIDAGYVYRITDIEKALSAK